VLVELFVFQKCLVILDRIQTLATQIRRIQVQDQMLHELVVAVLFGILACIQLELCPAIVAIERDIQERVELDCLFIEHKILLLS
jgi:hypothetical protein